MPSRGDKASGNGLGWTQLLAASLGVEIAIDGCFVGSHSLKVPGNKLTASPGACTSTSINDSDELDAYVCAWYKASVSRGSIAPPYHPDEQMLTLLSQCFLKRISSDDAVNVCFGKKP